MRKLLFLLSFAFLTPFSFTACSTAPASRVTAGKTLEAVGASAQAAVSLAGQLYKDGKITQAQLQAVADFYDKNFQPPYRLAVAAVSADLSSAASPDLINLASQLAGIVAQYTK